MGITSFPQKTGTDWSKYTPISEINSFTAGTPADTYETVFSISGKGYLSDFIGRTTDAGGEDVKMRITIDGVVIFAGYSTNSSSFCALIQTSKSLIDSTGDLMIIDANGTGFANFAGTWSFVDYPHTDDTELEAVTFLAQPIFFNASLLIEVKAAASSAFVCRVEGGYIA